MSLAHRRISAGQTSQQSRGNVAYSDEYLAETYQKATRTSVDCRSWFIEGNDRILKICKIDPKNPSFTKEGGHAMKASQGVEIEGGHMYFGPHVYAQGLTEHYAYIEMEKLNFSLAEFLNQLSERVKGRTNSVENDFCKTAEECVELLLRKKTGILAQINQKFTMMGDRLGVYHMDLHRENVFLKRMNDGSCDVRFIDYGRVVTDLADQSQLESVGATYHPMNKWQALQFSVFDLLEESAPLGRELAESDVCPWDADEFEAVARNRLLGSYVICDGPENSVDRFLCCVLAHRDYKSKVTDEVRSDAGRLFAYWNDRTQDGSFEKYNDVIKAIDMNAANEKRVEYKVMTALFHAEKFVAFIDKAFKKDLKTPAFSQFLRVNHDIHTAYRTILDKCYRLEKTRANNTKRNCKGGSKRT